MKFPGPYVGHFQNASAGQLRLYAQIVFVGGGRPQIGRDRKDCLIRKGRVRRKRR